jgi:glycosyltransferase involved in cell wall biosynthesis
LKTAKHLLVITYWSFPDALIQTYTLPYLLKIRNLLPAGSKIYLFTLAHRSYRSDPKIVKQIGDLKELGIYILHFNYRPFGLLMIFKMFYIMAYLVFLSIFRRIEYIHAWCTPGGAIGYLIAWATGKTLVLDSFEPHAMPMLEGRTWKKNSLAFRILFLLEKLQYKRAAKVITAAPGMDEQAEKVYGIQRSDCFVKPACIDLEAFNLSKKKNARLLKELGLENKLVCVYAGKFGGLYLAQETFDFLRAAREYFGNTFRVLLLSGHSEEEILAYCRQSGLERDIIVKRFVPHHEIPEYMGLADFAISPVKPSPSRRYSTPIKNGEYWALGLPVVITRNISIDSDIIENNDIGYVLKELSQEEYLNAAKKIELLLEEKGLAAKIRAIAVKERNFAIADTIYRAIYASA